MDVYENIIQGLNDAIAYEKGQNKAKMIKNKLKGRRVILASASPRRRELLYFLCDEFEVIPADIDETVPDDVKVNDASEYLAKKKCMAVAAAHPDALVIGSDTIVVCDDTILGKPVDESDARKMLCMLSGRKHSVISGIAAACGGKVMSASDVTTVVFSDLSDEFLDEYIATGSPLDKAGAYGIQELDEATAHIEQGSLTNVIGLPIEKLTQLLYDLLEAEDT